MDRTRIAKKKKKKHFSLIAVFITRFMSILTACDLRPAMLRWHFSASSQANVALRAAVHGMMYRTYYAVRAP
eukprot:COSAG01_NODE_453_length_16866_cov_30.622175_7_plen_72_part_00